MNKNEFLDLLVSTKKINKDLIEKSKNIDDFPLGFEILKKLRAASS